MTQFSPQVGRVSNLMLTRLTLSQLGRTQAGMFRAQTQLSTGQAINRPSDDAVKAAAINVLDQRLELGAQRLRNLDHAESSLNMLDGALSELHDLILEAKTIASAQVNFASNPSERKNEALVVDSLIQTVFTTANRESPVGHMFGGSLTAVPPVRSELGGYRFVGVSGSVVTDLGLGTAVPLTLSPSHPVGGVSARKMGSVDLNPPLTRETRLSDLRGARGLGVDRSAVEFSFDGGERVRVDLSHADTIGDIADALQHAIRQYEAEHGVTILSGDGVSVTESSLRIEVVPGQGSEGDPVLSFFDPAGSTTAEDLGLAGSTATGFSQSETEGVDLDPKLTWLSPIGLVGDEPLGAIRLNNAGRSVEIDLSQAQTLQDVRNLIEGANLGVRVEINESATGINVVNELAAGSNHAMSIEEVEGNGLTATRLGIRTFARETRIADFNDGRGVSIITGSVDPVTGAAAPDKDVDFTIMLGDGRTIDVDLRNQDIVNVGTLIDRINEVASEAGINVPGEFSAGLLDGRNGLALTQSASLGGQITIEARNGSPAAFELGLMDGTYDAGSATFVSEDRARVRVDNLFTHLIDLHDALLADDTVGITLAGERLEASVLNVVQSRALVGGYARRVTDATARQEDRMVVDEQARSDLRDLDFAEAAVRFNLLQTQLQAGLQTAALLNGRTLLDFLG